MTPELDYNRLATGTSEDKQSTFQLGVYRGAASLAIFANEQGGSRGGPLQKISLSPGALTLLDWYLEKLETAAPETKFSMNLENWDPKEKKVNVTGSLVLGRDSQSRPYIGVTGGQMKPAKFILRLSSRVAMPTETAENERHVMAVKALRNVLSFDTRLAILNTSYKRDPNQQGGKGGYGGGGNRGGYGGGGNRPAASDIESEVPF